jgi:hypothetical protein
MEDVDFFRYALSTVMNINIGGFSALSSKSFQFISLENECIPFNTYRFLLYEKITLVYLRTCNVSNLYG